MMKPVEKIICNEKNNILDLSELGLCDEQMGEIVKMISSRDNPVKRLILYRNNIGDDGLKELVKLKNVEFIDLTYNNISEKGDSYLCSNGNRNIFCLENNNWRKDSPSSLAASGESARFFNGGRSSQDICSKALETDCNFLADC